MSLSWESLDHSRSSQRSELTEDEAERDRFTTQLAEVVARVSRKRKVLEQTEKRAKEKLRCLVSEMEESGEGMSQTIIDASVFESALSPSFLGGIVGEGLGNPPDVL